jgi:hypothetical protein
MHSAVYSILLCVFCLGVALDEILEKEIDGFEAMFPNGASYSGKDV